MTAALAPPTGRTVVDDDMPAPTRPAGPALLIEERDPELLHEELLRLLHRAHPGPIPGVGTPAWWAADDNARTAAVILAGIGWVIADPETHVRAALRQASHAISEGLAERTPGPSHAELTRRRAQLAYPTRTDRGAPMR